MDRETNVAPFPAVNKVIEQMQGLNNKLAYLSETVRTERARIESLKEGVTKLGQKIKKFERELVADCDHDSTNVLQEKIDRLCKEWDRIKPMKEPDDIRGDLSLIGAYVEEAICCHVLPDVFVNESCPSLHDLLDYLNESEEYFPLDPSEYNCEVILKNARERWENVCEIFNFPDEWKTKTGGWRKIIDCTVPGDIRAMELLKLNVVTKQPVSLTYAEQNVELIKDKMAPWQFELVASFITSLRDKMKKSGIHHANIRD